MLSLLSTFPPPPHTSASYSIPEIVKFQTMIHQAHSECLRLQRKAAPMSLLRASGPQFRVVASLEHRTGFHHWSLVICWNNNLWAVINPPLTCRITEAGGMSVFFMEICFKYFRIDLKQHIEQLTVLSIRKSFSFAPFIWYFTYAFFFLFIK